MPRRKFIDKKNANTYSLVFRPQDDPLIHDEDAPDMVFKPIDGGNASKAEHGGAHKIKTRGDLEDEFGIAFRANEGQAAGYGVYYDDTEYDYMQHMAEPGGGTVLIEAPLANKGKGKTKLEDALRDMDLGSERGVSESGASSYAPDSLLEEPQFVQPQGYQNQQDIPDEIAGFQPDMDPRLREVLEALDDDAYVDDEEDFFAELAQDGEAIERTDWERSRWLEEEDDGWETDDTIKAGSKDKQAKANPGPNGVEPPSTPVGSADDGTSEVVVNEDWMSDFRRFKQATDKGLKAPGIKSASSELQSGLTGNSSLFGGKRKKRKGALTSGTRFSMTSSALARTNEQTLLDDRFDKIAENYAEDDENLLMDDHASLASGMTGLSNASRISKASAISTMSNMSSVSSPMKMSDLEALVDDFQGNYATRGKRRRVVRNKHKSGIEEYDELRRELGPARLKA